MQATDMSVNEHFRPFSLSCVTSSSQANHIIALLPEGIQIIKYQTEIETELEKKIGGEMINELKISYVQIVD
jgi:hypothetical protein